MTIHLAGIKLKDYCGFRNTALNFLNENDKPRKITVIYGPNGVGKSSLIKSIQLVSNPFLYQYKNTAEQFQKLVYNNNYSPGYMSVFLEAGGVSPYHMQVQAAFEDGTDLFKIVTLEQQGLIECDLEKKNKGYAYSIDADNPMNLSKFQLADTYKDIFLDMANTVYGFDCKLEESIEDSIEDESGIKQLVEIYTDFTINKNGTTVHFKSMSAGEKKVAKLLSALCNPDYIDNLDIVLIDNVELHVYYKRHADMIDKIIEHFPNKQFIVTSHSETLINYVGQKYGIDALLDLEKIKEM